MAQPERGVIALEGDGSLLMSRDPALIRSRFMKGLGTGRGGALDA